ncbi:MAG: hypothetical protein AVDCRST_MAG38-2708, partial [uncultured Solirubrobacteraceae bacterium]
DPIRTRRQLPGPCRPGGGARRNPAPGRRGAGGGSRLLDVRGRSRRRRPRFGVGQRGLGQRRGPPSLPRRRARASAHPRGQAADRGHRRALRARDARRQGPSTERRL